MMNNSVRLGVCGFLLFSAPAAAQWTADKPGSDNVTVLGHIELGPRLSVADMDVEQEISRPYA